MNKGNRCLTSYLNVNNVALLVDAHVCGQGDWAYKENAANSHLMSHMHPVRLNNVSINYCHRNINMHVFLILCGASFHAV